MMRLLTQMLKLPVAAFVYSVEMLFKTMQEMQRMADQGIDALVDGIAPARAGPGHAHSQVSDAAMSFGDVAPGGAAATNHTTHEETSDMTDVDLRGDAVKLVRYFIVFNRRDYEAYLGDDTEVITYSTNEGDYQGSKKAEFLAQIAEESAEIPDKWRKKNYPPEEFRDPHDKTRFIGLPRQDIEEFLKVKVELVHRYERHEAEYEKDQADALEKLASAVKDGKLQVEK